MQFIQGQQRQQTYFSTLEAQVSADNAVRLMDAFILLQGKRTQGCHPVFLSFCSFDKQLHPVGIDISEF